MGKHIEEIDLYSAVTPLFYLCKIFGLASVKLVKTREDSPDEQFKWTVRQPSVAGFSNHSALLRQNSRERYQQSITGIIYNVALAVVIVCAASIHFKQVLIKSPNKDLQLLVHLSSFILKVMSSLSIMILSRRYWDTIGRMLEILSVMDDTLMDDKVKIYSFTRMFVFLEILLICLMATSTILIDVVLITEGWFKMIYIFASFHFGHIINLVFSVLVSNMALLIKQRLYHLNEQLSKLASTYTSKRPFVPALRGNRFKNTTDNVLIFATPHPVCILYPTSTGTVPTFLHRLGVLKAVHNHLCDAIRLTNEMFGVQLLLNWFVNTTSIVSSLHFMIVFFYYHHHDKASGNISSHAVNSALWMLATALEMLLMTLCCESVSLEVNNTLEILQEMTLLKKMDQPTMVELQLFLQQVVNRKVCFTAGGVFNLNRSILCSTLGAVISYVVVLTQFNLH